MGWVARGLGPELAPSTLLPPLVELANDEEVMVRLAAVHSVVDLLGIVDEENCKQTIIPLVKKICENALHTEDAVLATISYQLGKLYLGLSAYLSVEEKGWFLDFFQQLALLGVSHLSHSENIHLKPMPDVVPVMQENADMYAEIRRHCAFNIPAMFLFSSSHDDFHQRLYPTFCDLVCDPHVDVRRTVASGVHEVARLLGPANRILKNELVHLLCDEAQEVLSAVVPNLSAILLLMTKFKNIGPDQMGTSVVEIGRAILKCEDTISRTYNWRLHSSLLSQLECLPHCLPAEYILSHLVPVLFLRIHKARPLPCRSAAAHTLLVFLHETVPNVRLKVCNMFPSLKSVLSISPDKKLLKAMETCIQALMLKETDRDVGAALSVVIDKLDAMEKNSETFPQEHLDEDKQKQEEEEKLERILEDSKKGVGIGSLVPNKSGPLLMEKLNRGSSFSKSVSGKESKQTVATKTGPANKFSGPNTVQHQIRADDTKIGMKPLHTSKIPGHSVVRKGVGNVEMKAQKIPVKEPPVPSSSLGFRSPMMPDTLDPTTDEFYIDAGVRIQTTLSNKSSPVPRNTCIPVMRVPTIREMLFSSQKQEALSEYQQAIGVTSICSLSASQSEVLSGITSSNIQSSYGGAGNMIGVKRSNISGKSGSNITVKTGSSSIHKTRMVVASCSDLPTPSQPYIFPIKNVGEDGEELQNESNQNTPRKSILYTGNKRLQYNVEGSKSALDRTNNDIKSSGAAGRRISSALFKSPPLPSGRVPRRPATGSAHSSPGSSRASSPGSRLQGSSGFSGPIQGIRHTSNGSSLLVRALPIVKKQRSVGVRGRQRQSTGSSLSHEESTSENISRRWILKKDGMDENPNWRRKSVDGSSLMGAGGRRASQRPLSVGGGITASTSRLPVPTLRKT
ncbi:hypothetical protein J437_LFUL011929 [Ladona fulva]|uniref:Serine/threonine-protein phosphatase 4 regulatory subunit 4 n=1 Tax=Ladona fulva TaxID=123851 RepID=A0A8K0K218_LADFU|nr:hypothetical protein J437_LFUL011929 [Ladona fulva]